MEARIIGPEAELGDVRGGLTIFGHTLTRDWSKIDPTPDQVTKLKGNRYVELKGAEPKPKKADDDAPNDDDRKAVVLARLQELGVAVDGRKSLTAMQADLDKAEKAQAKAEEEAADAQAAADEAAAKAGLEG